MDRLESTSLHFAIDWGNDTYWYPELLGSRNKETHTVPRVAPGLEVTHKFWFLSLLSKNGNPEFFKDTLPVLHAETYWNFFKKGGRKVTTE